MNPNDTGSFGANAGGMSPELQAAIQARQTQGPVTQQVTQGSPNANPAVQPLSMPQPPSMVPQSAVSAQQGPTSGPGPSNGRVDDAHIILKAMAGRLKSQEKIAEAQVIPPKMPTGQGM